MASLASDLRTEKPGMHFSSPKNLCIDFHAATSIKTKATRKQSCNFWTSSTTKNCIKTSLTKPVYQDLKITMYRTIPLRFRWNQLRITAKWAQSWFRFKFFSFSINGSFDLLGSESSYYVCSKNSTGRNT